MERRGKLRDVRKERGWILRILNKAYPDGMDADTIKKQLVELRFLTGETDIRAHIAYISDKGFIRLEEVGAGSVRRTVVSLTADGKDLIDGVSEAAPGVDI